MKKKTIVAVAITALLAIAISASAQSDSAAGSANFTYRYNLDSTTLIYCKLVGAGGNPYGGSIVGPARIKTTGSSVSLTANTAAQAPFNLVLVKDVIVVNKGSAGNFPRVIQTRADADNATVDTAVDLTGGFEFRYYNTICGSTATDGWIDVSNYTAKSVTFNVEQISGVTGGIDFRLECKGQALGDQPTIVHPGTTGTCAPGTVAAGFCNVTTAGQIVKIDIPPAVVCPQLRVGMKIDTSDAAEVVEADNERLTITVNYERGK